MAAAAAAQRRALLSELFGESDDDDDFDDADEADGSSSLAIGRDHNNAAHPAAHPALPATIATTTATTEEHPDVPGLLVARGALSPATQSAILATALATLFDDDDGTDDGTDDDADNADDADSDDKRRRKRPRRGNNNNNNNNNNNDQAMRFGASSLPPFVAPVAAAAARMLPASVVSGRRALAAAAAAAARDGHDGVNDDEADDVVLFDQMIANRYTPGQGIVDHVDLVARFEDGVAVASFGSCVVMEFRPVRCDGGGDGDVSGGPRPAAEGGKKRPREGGDAETEVEAAQCEPSATDERQDDGAKKRTRTSEDAAAAAGSSSSSSSHPRDVVVPVLLRPGDVICLTGDARYRWMHGIPARTEDWWEGAAIARRERVSITLRKLTLNGSLLTY